MLSINGPARATSGWQIFKITGPSLKWGSDANFQWSTSGRSIKYSRCNGDEFRFCIDPTTYETGDLYIYCNVLDVEKGISGTATAVLKVNHAAKEASEKLTVDFTDNSDDGLFREYKGTIILDPVTNMHSRFNHNYDVIWTFDTEHKHIVEKHEFGRIEKALEDFIDELRGTPGYLNLNVKVQISVFDCIDAEMTKNYIIEVSADDLKALKEKRSTSEV